MKRLLLSVLLALLLHVPTALAAGAYDSVCTPDLAGTVSATCNVTVGSVSDGAIVIGLSYYGLLDVESLITCTVDGVSAPFIVGTDAGAFTVRTLLYGKAIGTTSGSKTAACAWTTADHVVMAAMSFSGIDQAAPFQNGTSALTFSTGPLDITVTSTTGNMTVAVGSGVNSASLSAATKDQRYLGNSAGDYNTGSGQTASGASTVNFQWTYSQNSFWAISAVDLKASSGGVVAPRLMLTGTGDD